MRLASKMIRRTAFVLLLAAVTGGVLFAAEIRWECHQCHQQYQGQFGPVAKCSAGTKIHPNHIWVRKN